MPATVAAIYRYPVKGLSAEALASVRLEPGRGLPGDRRFALTLGSTPVDGPIASWMPKRSFLTLMRNERLAALETRYDEASATLFVRRNGKDVAKGRIAERVGRAVIEDFFAAYMGEEARGRPRLVEAEPPAAFADNPDPLLSIVNLASVKDLERVARAEVNPLRFRANVYVEGWPAWAEFGWIGQEVALGPVRLKVIERIGRCAATCVDPATARRDLNVPEALERGFGHADTGVYARVAGVGTLAVGDAATLS